MFMCVKHIGYTMDDVLKMRTATRRHQLTLLINEQTAKREHIEEEQMKQAGKGQRRVSGDMLKAEIKNPDSKLGKMIRGET